MQAIRAGRMDPEGESMTNIGRILGIVETILLLVGVCLGLGWLFLVIAIGISGAAARG